MTELPSKTKDVDPFAGFVLGMAAGDALGLPREGISARRATRLFGAAPIRHRFVFGRGMVSDDTEHMRMTALALLAEPADPDRFANRLAWKLRWWFLGLPAGMGLATAKSIIRLWLGWQPGTSGVYSAGNGPAMRAGVLGLCLYRDDDPLGEFVRSSTRITHVDPRAETGAMLIALAAQATVRAEGKLIDPIPFLQSCRDRLTLDREWSQTLNHVEQALHAQDSGIQFMKRLGLHSGISGYIVHTVAAVLFCWLRWPCEFRRPIEEIILLGGDADTTAAILGGLAGASCGIDAIPVEWIDNLIEWPYSVTWMHQVLSRDLRTRWSEDVRANIEHEPRPTLNSDPIPCLVRQPIECPPISRWLIGPAQLGRNLVFLVIVLVHGFRRLLPPY
jgi:ADP-ribosylglycohydrolase